MLFNIIMITYRSIITFKNRNNPQQIDIIFVIVSAVRTTFRTARVLHQLTQISILSRAQSELQTSLNESHLQTLLMLLLGASPRRNARQCLRAGDKKCGFVD